MKRSWFFPLALVGGLPLLVLLFSLFVMAQEAPKDGAVLAAESDAVVNWLHFGYDGSYTAHNPLEETLAATNVAQLEKRWGIGCDKGDIR